MTISLNPQFVVDKEKNISAVLLSINEWEKVIEALEELEDIQAYDRAKSGSQDSIPFEQAVREIEEEYKS